MIDYKLKYRAVLFLNATDIQANSKNIGILMKEFADKELLPNTFQEIPILLPGSPQNRFQLSSPNNEWIIRFGAMRFDFEKSPTDLKGSNLGDLKDFCNESKQTFERILNKYPRKGNRIALVTRFLLEEYTEDKLQEIYSKLFKAPKLYVENQPFEWNWRTVSHLKKEIDGLSEEFNFITQINRTLGEFRDKQEVKSIDRIELNLDINSLPKNVENRFGIAEINKFYDSVQTWHDEFIKELTEFLN